MSEYNPTPTQTEFMESDKFVRVIAGPIGSGKSVTCVHELVRLACQQKPDKNNVRRTRMILCRNTADQLVQTTRKTVFDWLPPGEAGTWKAVERTFILQATLADGTHVQSEWLFIALDTPDDVRKALSLECTFVWFNEARELHPEVVDGLLGRTGRYPSMKDGGPTRAGAIMDSNQPDEETWLWERMLNPPQNWSVHTQPPAILTLKTYLDRYEEAPDEHDIYKDAHGTDWVINPGADNLAFLHREYYPNLIPGKSEDWLRVYLRSEFGRSLSGTPVYEKTFIPDFHLSKDRLIPLKGESYPVVIGQDFGRTPAAVFKQRDPRGRVLTLGEVTSDNMGLETFLNQKLKPYISSKFLGCSFVVAPDPAGFDKSQMNEMTLVDVLKQAGFKVVRPPSNDPVKRIAAVERLLNTHTDGKASYLIDPVECPMLVKGFKFGYRYKIKKNGELEDRPEKNEYSHCFVAETPVLTPAGYVPIHTLLPGDFVMTRDGPKEVLGTMNRLTNKLVKVTAGGRSVVCTPEHPFLVDGCRVRADALKYANILQSTADKTWGDRTSTRQWSSTASGITANLRGITNVTTSWAGRIFTATSGFFTTARYQLATTSTIGTGIKATTTSPTSSCSARATTRHTTAGTGSTTPQTKSWPIWMPFVRWLCSGTGLTRGERGIGNMPGGCGATSRPSAAYASTARGSTTEPSHARSAGSALPNASPPRDAQAESITRSECASGAQACSASISTPRQVVAASAAVQPLDVDKPAVVYDLTVADAHEFFANGMLVSNCHDANQYADSVIDSNIRGAGLQGKREVKKVEFIT